MESKINEQEEKLHTVEVAEDEEDDGPPPGFQCIITTQPTQVKNTEIDEEEDDDDEGPPPGFHSISLKPSISIPSDLESGKQKNEEDEEDGPPPGWEFFPLANALPKLTSETKDANAESNGELNEGKGDDDDEAPPPGWKTAVQHQMPPPCTPQLQPLSSVSSNTKMGIKQETAGNNDDTSQSVSKSTTLQSVSLSMPFPVQSLPPTPQMQQLSSTSSPGEAGSKENVKAGINRPSSVQASSPNKLLPPVSHKLTSNAGTSSSEKAQLVCGTCRKLLLYPRAAKWVQCPGCQEVNFVMEAHEVGQVKCGNCAVLLMYPYGAPAVQCTSCRSVTEVGAINRRPPLSVQLAQRRRRPIRGRAH